MDGSDLCVTVALPAALPAPADEDTVGDVGVVSGGATTTITTWRDLSDGIAVVSRYLAASG